MDINRTGPRNAHFDNPAQRAEQTAARFQKPALQSGDPGAAAPPIGVPPGVTQADLKDPRKTEEILTRCFGDLVDNAGSQLGVPVSDEQKRNLLDFLGKDPVMRGKLLNFLEQSVK
jgi:hypothetical protein